MSWGQKTGWDRKQEPQNLIGRSNGMAPTGLPKPRLCQFDWTQLKGKKENANKKKTKDKDKEQLCQMGGQGSGLCQGRRPAAWEHVPKPAEPTLLNCTQFLPTELSCAFCTLNPFEGLFFF